MKKISIPILLLFVWMPFCGMAQVWQSIGDFNFEVVDLKVDTANNLLYASGLFGLIDDSVANHIAVYDGIIWDNVGMGTGPSSSGGGKVYSIEFLDNQIFATGQFIYYDSALHTSPWEPTNAARWDEDDWSRCGDPSWPGFFDIMNGELFFIGIFDSISGQAVTGISKWNGTEFEAFGDLLPDGPELFYCMEYYKGSYYFAGNFNLPGGLNEIMSWDGTKWNALQSGVTGDSWVRDIIEYKGLLWVAGEFHTLSGNIKSYLMAWDGSQWLDPLPGVQFTIQVRDLEVIGDTLYFVSGSNYLPGKTTITHQLAWYDGETFCSFGTGKENPLSKIASYKNRLFVSGGWISTIDTIRYLAEWVGGHSTDTCISLPLAMVKPLPEESEITVSPNPSDGVFNIDFAMASNAEIKLEIFDQLGRRLPDESYAYHLSGNKIELDLHGTPPGIYLGYITHGKMNSGFKLVKQ